MDASLLATASAAVLRHRNFNVSRPFPRPSSSSLQFRSSRVIKNQASDAPGFGYRPEKRVDESNNFNLEGIRKSLERQENTIIFTLVQRSHFRYNAPTYDPNGFKRTGFNGCLIEFMLKETEKIHSTMGRYTNPDEHAFFPDILLQPCFRPPLEHPNVLHSAADTINVNARIWDVYLGNLLPRLAEKGDDGQYASTAACDTLCLQTLSKRIHYGKFIAEAKFRAAPDVYEPAIRAQDEAKLMDLLTNADVEEGNAKRVEFKTRILGLGFDWDERSVDAINPTLVADLYIQLVMPLTKQVQVEYLLRRLD